MARVLTSTSPIFSTMFVGLDPSHPLLDSERFKNHHQELVVRDVPDAPLEGRVISKGRAKVDPAHPSPAMMPPKSKLAGKRS